MTLSIQTTAALPPEFTEKTLVLRGKVNAMKTNVEITLQERTEEFKKKIEDASDEDLTEFIENSFAGVQKELNDQLAAMKAEVLRHAPKRPIKEPGQSDEEFMKSLEVYERNRNYYKHYVSITAAILAGLAALFAAIFKQIHEFFRSLFKQSSRHRQKSRGIFCFPKEHNLQGYQ
jgi:hypothetical protein